MTTGVFTEAINNKVNNIQQSAENMLERLLEYGRLDSFTLAEEYEEAFGTNPPDITKEEMALNIVKRSYPTAKLKLPVRTTQSENSPAADDDDDPGDGGAYAEPASSAQRVDVRMLMLSAGRYSFRGTIIGDSAEISNVLHAYEAAFNELGVQSDSTQIESVQVQSKNYGTYTIFEFALGGSATAILNVLANVQETYIY